MSKIYILLSFFLLTGCNFISEGKKPDKIPEGQVLVYLYLSKYTDEKVILSGKMVNGFFKVLLAGGEYYYFFTISSENIILVETKNKVNSKSFNFEANKTYYIRCGINSSYGGLPFLEIVNENIAKKEIREYKFTKKYTEFIKRDKPF